MEQDQDKKGKADLHDHHDHLPKDILNNEQEPGSFRDPLEVQKEKEANMRKVSGPIDDTDPAFGKKEE